MRAADSSLSEAARRALEALMKSGHYEVQTELFRQWVAQGREEGVLKGRQEGRQEGELAALLEVLDARGMQVDEGSRQRLAACKDLEQFKLWLRKALTIHAVQELFAPEPAPRASARKSKAWPEPKHAQAPLEALTFQGVRPL